MDQFLVGLSTFLAVLAIYYWFVRSRRTQREDRPSETAPSGTDSYS